jgi:hypothetical protein
MAETPTTEFWRNIKPIQKVFRRTRCRTLMSQMPPSTTTAITSGSARPFSRASSGSRRRRTAGAHTDGETRQPR